ncbi:Hypothetical protein D9617_1g080320 [Elsinoe fawcettii]|nr:Hypothetical protein D9617_1g080320 [Elsinoe fawcettii]
MSATTTVATQQSTHGSDKLDKAVTNGDTVVGISAKSDDKTKVNGIVPSKAEPTSRHAKVESTGGEHARSASQTRQTPQETARRIDELQEKLNEVLEKLGKVDAKKEKKSKESSDKSSKEKEIKAAISRQLMTEYDPKAVLEDKYDHFLTAYYDSPHPTMAESNSDEATEADGSKSRSTIPTRLVITSKDVLKELGAMSGVGNSQSCTSMLPPYRLLVCHRDDMTQKLPEFEKALSKKQKELEAMDDDAAEEETKDGEVAPKTAKETDVNNAKQKIEYWKLLMTFIDDELSPIIDFQMVVQDKKITEIAFEDLWQIFKPGEILFKTSKRGEDKLPLAFRVHCVKGGRPEIFKRWQAYSLTSDDINKEEPIISELADHPSVKLVIDCHYIDFDGKQFGPMQKTFNIAPYHDTKRIVDLDVFPAWAHPDHVELTEKLQQRGDRFYSLTKKCFRLYEGMTLNDPEEISGEVAIDFQAGLDTKKRATESAGRIYLPDLEDIGNFFVSTSKDVDTWEKEDCGQDDCAICILNHMDKKYPAAESRRWRTGTGITNCISETAQWLPAEYKVLLTDRLIGYHFKSRTWHELDIDFIKELDRKKDLANFDDLVLDQRHKDLLLAVVQSHSSGQTLNSGAPVPMPATPAASTQDTASMDVVAGKGKGLIILLHGAPGVGKTLTAETIASHTERPLYPITCGDLGQEPEIIENRLRGHFKLAHKWGCVLLLDEADVFLAARTRGDVTRNGLVSVFLRELEYYSGILFLTTNQVGVIDEAFKSRIHISLFYPNLSRTSTKELWRNHLRRIKDMNKTRDVQIKFSRSKILDFADEHFLSCEQDKMQWNGRQVRNAFQTAIALAEYERTSKIRKGDCSESASIDLTVAHFDTVANATRSFDEYMFETRHGKDEIDVAAFHEFRAADFVPSPRLDRRHESNAGAFRPQMRGSRQPSAREVAQYGGKSAFASSQQSMGQRREERKGAGRRPPSPKSESEEERSESEMSDGSER